MVTVETAIAIAALMALLVVVVGGCAALLTQIAVVDAAREAARVAAISGPQAGVEIGEAALSRRAGAQVDVRAVANQMHATARAAAPGLPRWVGVELSAEAVASAEPGISDAR